MTTIGYSTDTTGTYSQADAGNGVTMCNCLGPQTGEKFCPCLMNRMGAFMAEKQSSCLWDQFTEEQKKLPMSLACPCPKCSAS